MHHMMHDADGPQKREILWALELIRRAIHVAYINHKKTKTHDLESSLDTVFGALRKLTNTIWADDPAKRVIARGAAHELRRVVERSAKRRGG